MQSALWNIHSSPTNVQINLLDTLATEPSGSISKHKLQLDRNSSVCKNNQQSSNGHLSLIQLRIHTSVKCTLRACIHTKIFVQVLTVQNKTPHKIKHRVTVVLVRKAITDQAPQGDTQNWTHICSQAHTLAYIFKGGKEGWSLQNVTFTPPGVS